MLSIEVGIRVVGVTFSVELWDSLVKDLVLVFLPLVVTLSAFHQLDQN